jgi:putative DNA primase/helicase
MSPFDSDPISDAPRGLLYDQYSSTELGKLFGCDEPEEPMEDQQWSGPKGDPPKFDGESNLWPIEQNIAPVHPTAIELVAGIAKAGEEGRIDAWRGNGRDRDFEPAEQPDGSWLICCPAHDDHNPSFVASDGVDKDGKPKLLVYCRSGCSQDKLIKTLDGLGLWNCTPSPIKIPEAMSRTRAAETAKKPTGNNSAAIVPIPTNAPPPPDHHFDLGAMTKCWAYRNAAGELVFYVCRFDPNPIWEKKFTEAPKHRSIEKPDHKTFRPLSYRKYEDGTARWSWIAPKSDIPLYNADKLAANPTAKVIVCEGEKAADAAQELFPDCVAVTWYSGAKAVGKAPWEALHGREVLIWPDHDEAGSQACQAILNALRLAGCASIAVLDANALTAINPLNPDGAKREPPQKWDAADAKREWKDCARLRKEVDRNSNRLEDRVRVALSPDNIGETVSKAEDALRTSSLPIFRRGDFIVRAGQSDEKSPGGETQRVLTAQKLNVAGLGEALESVIRFEQYDARKKGTKPVHAPDLLLKTFLERGKLSGLKPLTGITDIPLVRHDGSLLDAPGYDEATGIYYQPSGLTLDIAEDPTLDDAKEATETLKHLIRDFPFQSKVDMAAAISAFISAVNRPTLGSSPMHAFTSPTPGSGKSLLATLVTIISTGSLPSFITQGADDEELEKRVSAQMLAGRRVINIDNCNHPIKGSALCNLLTAESVSLRILGRSEMPDIISSSFILINGNNVRLADDMVRRTVLCNLKNFRSLAFEKICHPTWLNMDLNI